MAGGMVLDVWWERSGRLIVGNVILSFEFQMSCREDNDDLRRIIAGGMFH
jgi:hypothetical protein